MSIQGVSVVEGEDAVHVKVWQDKGRTETITISKGNGMKRCGVEGPNGALCDAPDGRHVQHSAMIDGRLDMWPNEEVLAQEERRTGPRTKGRFAKANEIAGSARPAAHVVHTGVPDAAVKAWSKEDWVRETTRALHAFLLARTEPFTTPEDLWPLIVAPKEKRSMVIPVRRAIAKGWMREAGAKRLTGTYHSADHVEFAMNKIVPVYESLVANR